MRDRTSEGGAGEVTTALEEAAAGAEVVVVGTGWTGTGAGAATAAAGVVGNMSRRLEGVVVAVETAGVVVVVAAGLVEMRAPRPKRSMTGAGEVVEAGPVSVVFVAALEVEGAGAEVTDEVEADDTEEEETGAELEPRLASSRPSSSSSCAFSLSSSVLSSSADLPPFTKASGSLWNTDDRVEICMIWNTHTCHK
jgi:hypothetical protein